MSTLRPGSLTVNRQKGPLPMLAYRALSTVVAAAYISLVLSINVRPPTPREGQQTVFEGVYGTGIWGPMFMLGALAMLFAVAARPELVAATHSLLFVAVLTFATANAYNSIVEGSGWIIASLCVALGALHALAVTRRPV